MKTIGFYFRKGALPVLFLALFVAIMLNACKKNDDKKDSTNNTSTGPSNNPTAVAANDNNAGGIYKGIVTGSAGYVYIFFKNSSNLVYAILDFDNVHDSLTCSALNGYTLPGGNIDNAVFTSVLGKQDTIIFSVKGDGTSPSMQVLIPGHKTSTSILKETSTQELKVYKGEMFDTLVDGFYYCGTNVISTLGSVRPSSFTAMVQGNNVVLLPGGFLPPCTGSNPPSALVLQSKDNVIELEMGGPPKKKFKIQITDTAVYGTSICTVPIDRGGEIDAYNTYIHTTRVK